MRERWGSFSVGDHRETEKLVTDVLAYDRLVFPVPPKDEKGERHRWENEGWQPGLLDDRLRQLGDRAIQVPWDHWKRQQFAKNIERVHALTTDADTLIPDTPSFQMTRRVLAQDDTTVLPPGVTKATVVSAYHSFADLQADFLLDGDSSDARFLSLLVRNRISQPYFIDDPESSLSYAIELSRSPEFQEKRRDLYRWEDEQLAHEVNPTRAMEELEHLIARYNECVEQAQTKVAQRFIFTLMAAGLPLTGALLGNPIESAAFGFVAAGSAISLVRFATTERTPVVVAGEAKAAAMFHDIKSTL